MRALQLSVALGLTGILASCSSSSDDNVVARVKSAEILSFTATPTEVLEGDPLILSWATKEAVQIRIENDAGKPLYTATHGEGTFSVRPDRSQLYTLVARGRDGKEIETQVAVRTRAGERPDGSFSVQPEVADVGSPVTLQWDTKGASRVVIREGDKVVFESDSRLTGGIDVIATKPTVYTLTAVGPWGQWVVPAEVKTRPVIVAFSAGTAEPVAKGSEAGVSWKTKGASELVVRTPEGGNWNVPADKVEAGSMVLPVGQSGTFELVAKRAEFEATRTSQVAILGAPAIRSFEISRDVITQDEPTTVTVSWKVDHAHGGELTWGNGHRHKIHWTDIGQGSLDIELADPTDIRLTVNNTEATSASTARVTTIAAPAPRFNAPRHVPADEPFVVQWSAPGAVQIDLYQDGENLGVPADAFTGSLEVQIAAPTTFRIEARNAVGSVRTATLQVAVGAPQVASVKTDKVRYGAGHPMSLSWDVTGGTRIQVLDEAGEPIPGCDLESAGYVGSCRPNAPLEFGTYTWHIEAESSAGRASRPITFRVGEGPAIDRFEANLAYVALGADLKLSWVVLDDVDGPAPDITITDNRGGRWTFRGTHLEPGSLTVSTQESGDWDFELTASAPGKEPVVAHASVVAVGTPTIEVSLDRSEFDAGAWQPLTLQWNATNASQIEVFATNPSGDPMGRPVHVTTVRSELRQGSVPVYPMGQGQGYLVIASNPVGESAEDIVFTTTTGRPTNPLVRFDVSATTVPAGTPVTVEWGVWGFDTKTTLAPFLDDDPVEITATAPFINIRQTGTPISLVKCGYTQSWSAEDEGCQILNFPGNFTTPFDGIELAGVTVTANGAISTTLSTSLLGTYSEQPFPTSADSSRNFIQFGLLWDDLSLSSSDPIRYQLFDGPEGRHLVIQYSNVSSNTFQAVFWESGAIDYRYAAMSSNGSSRVIGWQDRDRTKGKNLNGSSAAVPGGLANRSWRWFEKVQPTIGSRTFTVNRTTIFTLCASTPDGRRCEKRTVRVQ